MTEESEGATDLITQGCRIVAQKLLPCILLVIDDLLDDFLEASDDLEFPITEGRLVRDLKEISKGLGPLPIESAYREPDLVHRLNHLIHLIAQHKRG